MDKGHRLERKKEIAPYRPKYDCICRKASAKEFLRTNKFSKVTGAR